MVQTGIGSEDIGEPADEQVTYHRRERGLASHERVLRLPVEVDPMPWFIDKTNIWSSQ